MRIALRIAVAASLAAGAVVTPILGYFVASGRSERAAMLQRSARETASLVRSHVERIGLDTALASHSGLTLTGRPWMISIHSTDTHDTPLAGRIRMLVETQSLEEHWNHDEEYTYLSAIRQPSPRPNRSFETIAIIALSRDISDIQRADSAQLKQTLTAGLAAVLVIGLVSYLVARHVVSQPLRQLKTAVDDVAKGDLTSALFTERTDEIGTLAQQFTQMTTSLRDSQADAARSASARQHLEEQLFRSEKLATMGQMAAEIAHEVGTPLNVIAGRARSLARRHADAEVQKHANIIAEQADRITRIIQRLLTYTRATVPQQSANADLHEVARATLDFLEGKLVAAQVSYQLSGIPAVARVDSDGIQQVALNFVLNAIQAMPRGGRLALETGATRRKRPGLHLAAEADFAYLAVSDSGSGIPPEDVEKIFEPFYTSRREEGGTGLGLSVSAGIVKDNDGWIDVQTSASGSMFTVYLPVAEEAA